MMIQTWERVSDPEARSSCQKWIWKAGEAGLLEYGRENEFFEKNHQKACFGNLTNSVAAGEEGLHDPMIGEAGRKFLADLLNQLTDNKSKIFFGSLAPISSLSGQRKWNTGSGNHR